MEEDGEMEEEKNKCDQSDSYRFSVESVEAER